MIDAHQHFWTTSRDDYGWLTSDDPVLYRDFGPDDLAPLMRSAGVERTVLVQAAPSVAETRYLLDIAAGTPWVAAVVGWVALDDANVETELDALIRAPALRGVRPMIQDIADDEWMLGPRVGQGLRALARRELAFDALVHPRHLSRLLVLSDGHPDLRVVIDHAAKPAIRTGEFDTWARDIARVAAETTAFCKISGLVTEAASEWRVEDLVPYVDHLLACFGPERLMWGSDWPVVDLAGGYDGWWQATQSLLAKLGAGARSRVLGGSAAEFYRLAPMSSNGGGA